MARVYGIAGAWRYPRGAMRVARCQECGTAISRYCRKCPYCCARNPTYRRRSPLPMFILALLMGCAVFIVKNLKPTPPLSAQTVPEEEARSAG